MLNQLLPPCSAPACSGWAVRMLLGGGGSPFWELWEPSQAAGDFWKVGPAVLWLEMLLLQNGVGPRLGEDPPWAGLGGEGPFSQKSQKGRGAGCTGAAEPAGPPPHLASAESALGGAPHPHAAWQGRGLTKVREPGHHARLWSLASLAFPGGLSDPSPWPLPCHPFPLAAIEQQGHGLSECLCMHMYVCFGSGPCGHLSTWCPEQVAAWHPSWLHSPSADSSFPFTSGDLHPLGALPEGCPVWWVAP